MRSAPPRPARFGSSPAGKTRSTVMDTGYAVEDRYWQQASFALTVLQLAMGEGRPFTEVLTTDRFMLTPPLASGALPGVLRAELLADGRAREAVLWPEDLAGGFWLGNALRGLVRVALRPVI